MSSAAERVAKALKFRMDTQQISQTELAEKTGMTVQTINAFCNGRGKILSHSLEQMAQVLGTTAEEIFFEERPPQVPQAPQISLDALAKKVAKAVLKEMKPQKKLPVDPLFPEAEPQLLEIVEKLAIFNPKQLQDMLDFINAAHDAIQEKRRQKSASKKSAG